MLGVDTVSLQESPEIAAPYGMTDDELYLLPKLFKDHRDDLAFGKAPGSSVRHLGAVGKARLLLRQRGQGGQRGIRQWDNFIVGDPDHLSGFDQNNGGARVAMIDGCVHNHLANHLASFDSHSVGARDVADADHRQNTNVAGREAPNSDLLSSTKCLSRRNVERNAGQRGLGLYDGQIKSLIHFSNGRRNERLIVWQSNDDLRTIVNHMSGSYYESALMQEAGPIGALLGTYNAKYGTTCDHPSPSSGIGS